jgi:hypothetical protein
MPVTYDVVAACASGAAYIGDPMICEWPRTTGEHSFSSPIVSSPFFY